MSTINDNNITPKVAQLTEKQGLVFEHAYNLSPVVARVFALIILNGPKGTTFDELIAIISSSKGTISGALKTLDDRKMCSYFTKSGDRKRYFKPSPVFFLNRLKDELQESEEALNMHEQLIAFKKDANKILPKEEQYILPLTEVSPYSHFLSERIAVIKEFITNVEKMECNA